MDIDMITLVVMNIAAISETLSLTSGTKANGIIQMLFAIIKAIAKGIKKKEI